VPRLPGLYRIRRVGRTDLDYIGQTGTGQMNLRKRLAMLRGVYGEQMPYRDPHTAAPALWPLVQEGGTLEVSVAPVDGPKPRRLGLECVVIALYRQQHGCSPTVSFGRMPHGYRISSGNNARSATARRRPVPGSRGAGLLRAETTVYAALRLASAIGDELVCKLYHPDDL
jgi:hypothetical protein